LHTRTDFCHIAGQPRCGEIEQIFPPFLYLPEKKHGIFLKAAKEQRISTSSASFALNGHKEMADIFPVRSF